MVKAGGFSDRRVLGSGNPASKIWLIGESPGREEEKEGQPFVGQSGQELSTLLSQAGIERRDCYLDNIVQLRPTGDKELSFFPDGRKPSIEYMEGIKYINGLIAQHKPNVVVGIGQYSTFGLTMLCHPKDSAGIMSWRGSILSGKFSKCKVIPILHPSFIVRGGWAWRQPTIWDLERIKKESVTPELSLPEYDTKIVRSRVELDEAFEEIMKSSRFTFDIEIFGLRNLACIGFGLSNRRAICVPESVPGSTEFYRAVLESDIPKGNQNVMFDASWLTNFLGIQPRNICFDTMLSSHALFPASLPHTLEFLTSIYTRQPFYKEEGKTWRETGDKEQLWDYNCKDCCVTFEIDENIQQDLVDYGVKHVSGFMTSLIEPYLEAVRVGIAVDRETMAKLSSDAADQAEKFQAYLDKQLGKRINVRSHVQVKQVVYEDLGLPKRRRGGKLTSNQEVLMDLAAKTGNPDLVAIVKIRRLKKYISSWGSEKILDQDGRLRCNINISGTKTGRLSTTETLWGSGTNMLNFPEKARSFVVPDPGYSFVVLDQMQAESVVVAFLANDDLEIEWFVKGLDGHRMLAALIYNKDPEDVTPQERQLCKKCHHALNYRMGPLTFTYTVNKEFDETGVSITVAEATDIRNKYTALRPMLQAWWLSVIQTIRTPPHTLTTLMGRKRIMIERWSDTTINDFVSYNPQSTVADVSHEGVRRYWYESEMFKELRKDRQIVLVNNLYDGTTYMVRDELLDRCIPELAKLNLVELEANGNKFTIPVEVKIGKRWNKKSMTDVGVFKSA